LQPDLGSTALLISIMCLLMFIAGCRLRYIVPLLGAGVVGILGIALMMPERRGRLLAFIHPEQYRSNEGYQVWQALIAFGSGGMQGLGLGNSVQKMFYLPEAHTDFIFPIIGEELGLFWTLVVVSCFVLLALAGGYISAYAPDTAGALLGWGVTALICLQAVANIGVVTGCLPAKGLGLPFISYGGSNLVVCLACIGILLNIHRQALYESESNVLLAEA
ncbi:MAG: FtsW/RodA/SpoVE family cell cycle protein, partial [bacterium]